MCMCLRVGVCVQLWSISHKVARVPITVQAQQHGWMQRHGLDSKPREQFVVIGFISILFVVAPLKAVCMTASFLIAACADGVLIALEVGNVGVS